ncbi:MAG: DUF3188 domain-containing protein [Cyanobacteriota bacterium]|nr:DUF3188 domain-containing protein [Cyanobacteriota bacterium]
MSRPPQTMGEGHGLPPSRCTADLLALSSPLMMVLGLVSMVQRGPSIRLQGVPALLIGSGLLVFSLLRRRRRRSMLLRVLREPGPGHS